MTTIHVQRMKFYTEASDAKASENEDSGTQKEWCLRELEDFRDKKA